MNFLIIIQRIVADLSITVKDVGLSGSEIPPVNHGKNISNLHSLVPNRTLEQDARGLFTILTIFLCQLIAVYVFLNKTMEVIISGPEISLRRSCPCVFK